MKRLLLAGTIASAFCGGAAFAAPPAPVSWTGCYIGANIGDAWAHKDSVNTYYAGSTGYWLTGTTQIQSWVYGGQVGCEYQVNSILVVGIRGMLDGADMSGTNHWDFAPNSNAYKIDRFSTVVATVGFPITPTVEVYGLGGAALVHDHLTFVHDTLGPYAAANINWVGYDVGAGLSWMMAPQWSVSLEYDYMGFGNKTVNLAGFGPGVGNTYTDILKQNMQKVLVSLNFRFGGR